MQQFIQYLYEWEQGKRVRNIGFVKVEQQGEKYVVHIHGKGADFGTEKKLRVMILSELDEKLIGFSQGYVGSDVPTIHFILKFNKDDVGGEKGFSAVKGILLQNQNGKRYFASWDDSQPDLEEMIPWEEWEQEQEKTDEENLEAEETEEEEVEVEEYMPPQNRTYEKIQRQDLSRLPRKDWKLANNHFLLHGFYNYHHLLYITEDDHIWIGVPGIYHEKEEVAAKAFGFPQFHRLTDAELELSFEETDTVEDFGYWCRVIE